jgi:hypothetical protein
MTPEEFAARMRELYPQNGVYDNEQAHVRADELMCELLRSLGYGEGVDIFDAAERWYA